MTSQDIARHLGLTDIQLLIQLAHLGMSEVLNEARRLAHQRAFDAGTFPETFPAQVTGPDVVNAARSLLPSINTSLPGVQS